MADESRRMWKVTRNVAAEARAGYGNELWVVAPASEEHPTWTAEILLTVEIRYKPSPVAMGVIRAVTLFTSTDDRPDVRELVRLRLTTDSDTGTMEVITSDEWHGMLKTLRGALREMTTG